jgi:hypothetical protein
MNRSKDLHLVAYCSSCREDRGRHTLRGSHSSSHDSRRRYLSNAYQEKRPIFEERGQRHGSRWIRFIICKGQRHGFRGSMTNMKWCWLWSLIIFLMNRGPCFQPCLYPMKYLHPRSMYTLPRGGVQRGGTPSAGSGGSIPPAGGSGGKRAPSGGSGASPDGGSGAKPPKQKLPYKSIL